MDILSQDDSLTIPSEVSLLNYRELADALVKIGAPMRASQAHGLMCACICAGERLHGVAWLAKIMGVAAASDERRHGLRALLLHLYAVSVQQLQDMASDYALFLPNDTEVLCERAYALSLWCDGFIEGLALFDWSEEDGFPQEYRETLLRFSEIAKLDYSTIDVSQTDEEAYKDLVEYVKMAVLMICAEHGFDGIRSVAYCARH